MSEFLDDAYKKITNIQDELNYLTIEKVNKRLNSVLGDILAAKEEFRLIENRGDDE